MFNDKAFSAIPNPLVLRVREPCLTTISATVRYPKHNATTCCSWLFPSDRGLVCFVQIIAIPHPAKPAEFGIPEEVLIKSQQ
jgi:hypothetical protein